MSVRLACLMHAASVYPEPGSNSPKRCTTLRSRLLSEGLTTRTSLSRISCHSSVVKVQRPRRDGPRRRRRMMGLARRVSNAPGRSGPGAARRPTRGTSAERSEEARSPRAGRRRRRSASTAARARPSRSRRAGRRGPGRGRCRGRAAMPALASRSRISLTRLLIGRLRPPAGPGAPGSGSPRRRTRGRRRPAGRGRSG